MTPVNHEVIGPSIGPSLPSDRGPMYPFPTVSDGDLGGPLRLSPVF
jgi:hypothetical protein